MKKLLCLILALAMVLGTMGTVVFAGETVVAKIGTTEYTDFKAAMTDAYATSGDVEVEIYGAVEFVNGMELKGDYDSISFVGMNTDAQISVNQKAGGDYLEAHGETLAFTDLKLAKVNPKYSGNSGHMGNFFSVQGGKATYTNCTFLNGACTSGGTATYNNCTFQNDVYYGLWVYDNALVTVNGGTVDSIRGIKVYAEDETNVTSTLTVDEATFTDSITEKGAVCIAYAESVTLTGNVWNNVAPDLELDSGTDADCEGVVFVAVDANGNDIASTLEAVDRSNGNASCGVFVTNPDGTTKVYTTVTTAAADAVGGDTVTLLYDTDEQVTFATGVTVDTNNYTADNVVATPAVAKVGDNTYCATLQAAINAAAVGDTITLLSDVDYDNVAYASGKTTSINIPKGKEFTLDLNGYTISGENSSPESFELITINNGAVVTIDDTSAAQAGKITYEATREEPDGWIDRAHTIFNRGTLILDGGTIENATPESQEAVSSAVDNNCSWGNLGTFIMNGGVVTSAGYYAVRTDVNTHNTTANGTLKAVTEFNGGTVYGFYLMDRGSDLSKMPVNDVEFTVGDDAVVEPANYSYVNGVAIRIRYGKTSKVAVEVSEDAQINGTVTGAVAKVGGAYYKTLAEAVAVGGNIILLADATLESANIKADTAIDLNENTLTVNAGGISDSAAGNMAAIQAWADVAITNGNVVVSSAQKVSNGVFYVAARNDASLTIEDVNLTATNTNGTDVFVVCNPGTLSIINSTINASGVSKLINGGDGGNATITNSEINISDSDRAMVNIELTANDSDFTVSNLSDNAFRNVSGTINNTNIDANGYASGIKNDAGKTLAITGDSVITLTGATEYDLYLKGDATLTIEETATFEADNVLVEGENTVTGNVASKADSVSVKYVKADVDEAGVDNLEGKDIYEIVLEGANAEKINELASADLTFAFNGTAVTNGAMSYFVTPVEGVALTQLGDRFMFNYDGATKHEESDVEIVIGTITIDGYGTYTLATADATTNAVYATEIRNNIVEGFTPAATLITTDKVDATIAVPTRELTINIDFPNAVTDNAAAYQAMKVEITGTIDGVNQTVAYDLGKDGEYAMANGDYVVTEDRLVLNNAYTVTVSGAGYRTARYTVTMTEDKELNFWNNVMDEDRAVEEDVFATTKTFLAGDIVRDSNINVYDLSAVVSYFAKENNTEEYSDYAKYDLDRNGVIDSRDVAYVLVSWGE